MPDHEETQPEVEVHRFFALDAAFDDDDDNVSADVAEDAEDGEDVRLHGMSDFG